MKITRDRLKKTGTETTNHTETRVGKPAPQKTEEVIQKNHGSITTKKEDGVTTESLLDWDRSLVTLDEKYDIGDFNPACFKYIRDNDKEAVDNLKEAIEKRLTGVPAFSYRECDIAWRGNVSRKVLDWMSNPLFASTGSYLVEDDPAAEQSIYFLRKRYNDGLNWFRKLDSGEIKPIEEKIKQAKSLLDNIRDSLRNKRTLTFVGQEEEVGFNKVLLKPEYLSWEQFRNLRAPIGKASSNNFMDY